MKEQTTSVPNGTRLEILRPAPKNQPIEGPISARPNAQAVKILDAAREGPSGHGQDWQECGIRRDLKSLISYGAMRRGDYDRGGRVRLHFLDVQSWRVFWWGDRSCPSFRTGQRKSV